MPLQRDHERVLVDPGFGETLHPDLAWSYDFPTRQLLPIAGPVSFYNEKVDIFLDGHGLERPTTHFFKAAE